MNKSQKLPAPEQRVYDILCEIYPKWITKGEMREEYYQDYRESYDTYMGKLLSFLINKGFAESRRAVKDGKKQSYSEYKGLPQKAHTDVLRDSSPTAWKNGEDAEEGLREGKKLNTADCIQVDLPCPECGSYYRKNGKCNKCEK